MAEDEASRISAAAGVEPVLEAKGLSQGQIVRKRFFGHSGAMIGLVVFAFMFLLAFTSVGYLGHPRLVEVHPRRRSRPWSTAAHPPPRCGRSPGASIPFGQDRIGRDMFAMTMRGAQQSITVMLVIGLIAGLIGVVVGAICRATSAAGSRPC